MELILALVLELALVLAVALGLVLPLLLDVELVGLKVGGSERFFITVGGRVVELARLYAGAPSEARLIGTEDFGSEDLRKGIRSVIRDSNRNPTPAPLL